jgi:hypothetical protein
MSFKRLQTMQKKLRGNSTRDLRKVGHESRRGSVRTRQTFGPLLLWRTGSSGLAILPRLRELPLGAYGVVALS